MSSCYEILTALNLEHEIPMISLAKRIEEVFLPNNPSPILLKPNSAELKLLQRIRDEAHRFAITYHRNIRTKKQTDSILDKIVGIGPKKRDALLKTFKTSEEVAKASVDVLETVPGITHSLALQINAYFKHNPITYSPEE